MLLPYALPSESAVPSLALVSEWVETELPGVEVQLEENLEPLAVRFPLGRDESEIRFEIFQRTGLLVTFTGRSETRSGLVTVGLRIRDES